MTPYTGPANRSYSASNATWSPRATWTSRSSRSCSPLLSAVAGVNRDASESFGFTWHLRSRSRIGWVGSKEILRIWFALAWCGARSVRWAAFPAAAESPRTAPGAPARTRLRGSPPAHLGNQPTAVVRRGRLRDRGLGAARPGARATLVLGPPWCWGGHAATSEPGVMLRGGTREGNGRG